VNSLRIVGYEANEECHFFGGLSVLKGTIAGLHFDVRTVSRTIVSFELR